MFRSNSASSILDQVPENFERSRFFSDPIPRAIRSSCLIVLFNVMNETYTWRDQSVDNGFTVMGRYWNGDELQWAVWGLTSHASANMLNLATMRDPTTGNVLNAGGNSANAGANCGVQPDACGMVDVVVIVHAGDRILATMHTAVTK